MSLEIKLDKASKMYEPGEKVLGSLMLNEPASQVSHSGLMLLIEGYMDTVSIIRGNIGRAPMREEDRIYFMKKKEVIADGGKVNTKTDIPFDFSIEATVAG